ncbi:MAG: corrinoid protein [Desulfobacterales bacterium]|nr:corrinoid protein [Desulfobacterales bacterium]
MGEKQEILQQLAQAVVEMDEEAAATLAEHAFRAGIDPYEAITDGLTMGMAIVNEKFENEEYFVPEILLCADAMYAGLEVLRPRLKTETASHRARVVIGVVAGDTHDIGKNLVKMMLETAAFKVYDLGRNVPLNDFVDKALEIDARLICLSTLMTTTMDGMKKVIDILEEKGIRDRFVVMVGGGPISQSFADSIGADGYAANAAAAVRKANELIENRVTV